MVQLIVLVDVHRQVASEAVDTSVSGANMAADASVNEVTNVSGVTNEATSANTSVDIHLKNDVEQENVIKLEELS
jgi:hypothetical protein